MESQELRERLTEYIKAADDRKLAAMYKFVEDEIKTEYKWYEDEAFVKVLEERDSKLESGEDKGYTTEEMSAFLDKRKAERYAA